MGRSQWSISAAFRREAFPAETPRRGKAANGVLREPVTGLFAGWRQRRTLLLGACVGGVVSTTGDLMVVTQYRLLLVSLRVLVDKDAPAADREWWSMVSRIRRARG